MKLFHVLYLLENGNERRELIDITIAQLNDRCFIELRCIDHDDDDE